MSSPVSPTVERSSGGGLYDVVELILDKGLVIDAYVRVSLIGIEILSIEARVVIASVDTYLRYAQAINGIATARAEAAVAAPEPVSEARRVDGEKAREAVPAPAGD